MTDRIMKERQRPLVHLYRREPKAAWVTDVAYTEHQLDDPLHTHVVIAPEAAHALPISVHTAVGGESDAPTPGDVLCAALACCIDSTIRVVADRLGAELSRLSVRATAEVDVRGTLCMTDEVPVAFQRMSLRIDLELAPGSPAGARERLLTVAEHCCIVLQTLRGGIDVDVELADERAEANRATA